MNFISYAQNFEDIMLWRALKHVTKGFYIDIGAASPTEHSVTKAFYDKGWTGINVEPNEEFYRSLAIERPSDINLPVAVGRDDGTAILNIFSGTGLSTMDEAVKESHVASGRTPEQRQVQVVSLQNIWRKHVLPRQTVHFLKIDVEGMETQVIESNNWETNRPWILVVEATTPLSQVRTHDLWEKILQAASYRLAYEDGLNRFYVAGEHEDLIPRLRYPPNVLSDDFQLASSYEAHLSAATAREETKRIAAELAALRSSVSWRVTAPLRWLRQTISAFSVKPS